MFSPSEWEKISGLISFVKMHLVYDGLVDKNDNRFPFEYHHDFVCSSSEGVSRQDVMTSLDEWGAKHGALAYACQAINGACEYLVARARQENPNIEMPNMVKDMVRDILLPLGKDEAFRVEPRRRSLGI